MPQDKNIEKTKPEIVGPKPVKTPAGGKITTSLTEFINNIVFEAMNMGSSDIHIEPRETDAVVRFRVDGLLRDILTIDKNFEQPLIFKLKIAAKLQTDEHFAPQDGRIKFNLGDQRVDTRISIMPTTKGEKIVMRLLSSEGKSFQLEQLGLRGDYLTKVQRAYQKPYGTILAVGPTGSGKTTTLYSILKLLNSREVNITTIEDPVEYDISGVNQIQINPKTELTFATGLRSILRQDPDIIMVGEIRDSETARIAINAAMTGHLVLSTLHTNDSITTIPRLIDMGIEDYLISSTLNIIIAQRLARKLCESCKSEYKLAAKDYDNIKTIRPDIAKFIKTGSSLYKANGCNKCENTGYKGRIGLYEVLNINEALRDIISRSGSNDEIFEAASKDGLKLIVEDGIDKLKEGIISLPELHRVTALKE